MASLHRGCQFPAVQAGQSDIREHEIDPLVLVEYAQRFGSIRGFDDVKAELSKIVGREGSDRIVVLDYEYGFTALSTSLSCAHRAVYLTIRLIRKPPQVDFHGRAVSRLAVDLDVPFGLLHLRRVAWDSAGPATVQTAFELV